MGDVYGSCLMSSNASMLIAGAVRAGDRSRRKNASSRNAARSIRATSEQDEAGVGGW